MAYGKIKIDTNDQMFSEIVRRRAGDKCERCLKYHPWKELQCAHFHGRANKRVRWDLDNAAGLCYGCHQFLDSRAMEKVEWFRRRLGTKNFEQLNQRANWPTKQKVDKKALELFLKAGLKRYVSDPSHN